jgi:acid phosphatase class B
LSSTGEHGDDEQSRPTDRSREANLSPVSEHKDIRIFSILQINSSKILDGNGEPRVVHDTDDDFLDSSQISLVM